MAVQGEEQGGMSISLPRVNSAELLLFPETAEGHVSKVILLNRFSGSVCRECLNDSVHLTATACGWQ